MKKTLIIGVIGLTILSLLIRTSISVPISDIKIVEPIIAPAEVMQQATGTITLRQDSSVRSTGIVRISYDPPRSGLSVQPNNFGVTLDPNETKTFNLLFRNTGSDQERDITVTFRVTDAFMGAVTDSSTISVKLLKRVGGSAVLVVRAVDIDTGVAVPHVHINVTWDSLFKDGYTNTEGKKSFDMGTLLGAVVSITASENMDYYEKSDTTTLEEFKELVLKLKSKSTTAKGGGLDYTWGIVAVAIVCSIIASILILKKKKSKKED